MAKKSEQPTQTIKTDDDRVFERAQELRRSMGWSKAIEEARNEVKGGKK